MRLQFASLTLLFSLFLTSLSFGLDASINTYLNDKAYYRFFSDISAARFQYDVSLSGDLTENLNLSGILWSSHRFEFLNSGFTTPEELDYQVFLTYSAGDLSITANATAYTTLTALYELGLTIDNDFTTGSDIMGVSTGGGCYYDMKGFYQEFKFEPSLSLPLGAGVKLSLPVVLGVAENGFNGLSINGLTGLAIDPKLLIMFSDTFSLVINGGYYFSFSSEINSYAHGGLSFGFSFSSLDKIDESVE